jgi:hypothetical protein
MRLVAMGGLLILAGCGEQPKQAAADKTPDAAEAPDELKAEEKSIEQAADAAAKLVEEEANAEIEQAKGGE